MTALLEVTDLNVTFETGDVSVSAVRGTSYRIDPGEVVAIVGESGSGKSTAAMAVIGLLPEYAAVSGSVRLHDEELLGLSDQAMSRIRGKSVGTIFQDPMSALTPVYTIGDQIAEAIEVHNREIRRADARKRAVELLDLVGISQPESRARAFPHELSGGERQRVVIAIAIANDPDLLICDEPTTALDVTVQAQILDVLRTARDVTGAGVLIITHDLGVVSEFADRAMVMYAGRGVEIATVEDLYRDRRMPYTVGLLGSVPRLDAPQGTRLIPIPGAPPTMSSLSLGECPFAPRCPLVIDRCRSAEPALVTVGDGHRAACIRTNDVAGRSAAEIFGVSTQPAEIEGAADELPLVLRVTDLVKTYPLTKGVVLRRRVGEVRAVDGVSFTLEQGRTLGIVGESGSGKSTTLSQILELNTPQSGSIEILGDDVSTLGKAARRKLRTELQVVFQDPVASLDPRLPVFDVIAEPLVANGFDRPRCEERVAELLAIVGLDRADASRYPADFSGGQKQRIGIARALALRPKILALDEPVSALDVSIQAGVINLLLDLQRQFGLSYLFVSHDLSVVKHLAHRVAVMYRGTVVEQGEGDQVFTNPQHEYTRRLLAAVPRAHPDVADTLAGADLPGNLPSPIPSPAPAARGKPKPWILIGAAALVFVLVLGGLGTWLLLQHPHPKPSNRATPTIPASPPSSPTPASRQTVLPFTGLNGPWGVAVDSAGAVYVVDTNNGRVVKLAAGSDTPTVLPFTGLIVPKGLAVDRAGSVYVTDWSNGRVVKLAAGSSTPTVLPFTGLNLPHGVAVDRAGSVYVTDSSNGRVMKLAAGSDTPTVLPFTGLNEPDGVAVDSAGSVYVTDSSNGRVMKLAAGSDTPTELPFTGLNWPDDVAVDSAGDVYVTDKRNHRVVKLAAGSNTQTELPFTDVTRPYGVAVDSAGSVYITDQGHRIEVTVNEDKDWGLGFGKQVVKLAAG